MFGAFASFCVLMPVLLPGSDPDPVAIAQQSPERLLQGFVPNQGQFHESVDFVARGSRRIAFLSGSQFTLRAVADLGTVDVRFTFEGGNAATRATATDKKSWVSNYFIGNDPAKYATDVPAFGRVRYTDLYPGVDVEFFEHEGTLEYDVLCDAGRESVCVVRVEGAREVRLDEHGRMIVATELGEWVQDAPRAFVEDDAGARTPIDCRFVDLGKDRFGFELRAQPGARVRIDPTLTFSTYLGGTSSDAGRAITTGNGFVYVAGSTASANFPIVAGFDNTVGAPLDGFVVRMTGGGFLVSSTYFGGTSSFDSIEAISISGSNLVVAGTSTVLSTSNDFPITPGAFDALSAGSGMVDGFVAAFNSTVSALVFSTYIAGASALDVTAISSPIGTPWIDVVGNANGGIPVTPGAFDTTYGSGTFGSEGFLIRLISNGAALSFATYIGGTGPGSTVCRDVVALGSVSLIVGSTNAPGFPTTPGALDPTVSEAFVMSLFNGSTLWYASGLGAATSAKCIEYDPTVLSQVLVAGTTGPGAITTPGALDTTYGGGALDGFLMKWTDTSFATLSFGTYLGGSGTDSIESLESDARGNIYALVSTQSSDLETTVGAPGPTFSGGSDAFLSKLDSSGNIVLYASYLGGNGNEPVPSGLFVQAPALAIGSDESAFVTGQTDSANFPTTASAFDPTLNGGLDAFVTSAKTRTCSQTASLLTLGSGKSGTNGAPVLSAAHLPFLGAAESITISNGFPGAPAFLIVGANGTAIPFDLGMLLVVPTLVLTLPALDATGTLTLPFVLPDDSLLCGKSVYFQAIVIDPGAPGYYHTAQTNMLKFTFGS